MKNNNDNKNNKKISVDRLRGQEADRWMAILWDELLNKLSNVKSKKKLKSAFENLISEHEKKIILRRLAVNALIRSGKSYRKIGEILWVSPQTISAVRKNIFSMTAAYKSYRFSQKRPKSNSSIKFKQKKVSFLESLFEGIDLWDLLINPPRPVSTGLKAAARNSSSSDRI